MIRKLALATAIACLWPAAASANVIDVTTTNDANDDPDCGLREAINAANGSGPHVGCADGAPGLDVITLHADRYEIAQANTDPNGDDDNVRGDLDITSDVTIQGVGAGASGSVIDAQGFDRVLHVVNGTVRIVGVRFTGGNGLDGAAGGSGGAVGGNGGNGQDGGGIRNDGLLTLERCVITVNVAGDGGSGGVGGIGAPGANAAGAGTGGRGGDSVGGNGGSGGSGGGIYSTNPLTLIDTDVTDNVTGFGGNGAPGGSAGAGGTAGDGGTGGRGGDSFGGRGGNGGDGGGIASGDQLTISGGLIARNTANFGSSGASSGSGGAGGSVGTLATGGPGGDSIGGSGGTGGRGGGVRVSGAPVFAITGVTFVDNEARFGGLGAPTDIGGAGGAAPMGAGGAGGATMGGSGGDGGAGGGLMALTGGSVVATTFEGNSAGNGSSAAGGGAAGDGGDTPTGGAGGRGGDSRGGNGGQGASGGAIASVDALTLTNSTLAGNLAGAGGDGGTGSTGGSGGTGGAPGITGGVFGGDGGDGADGALSQLAGSAQVTHVTIAGNAAGGGGNPGNGPSGNGSPGVGGSAGAIAGAGVTLRNSIVASNTPGNCLGVVNGGRDFSFGSSPNCPGPALDPLLGPLQNNGGPTQTMALGAGSPAIDAVPASGANCAATDQRGITRPQGPACDAGAFEVEVPAPPGGNPPGGNAPQTGRFAGLRVRRQTITIRGSTGFLRASCPAGTPGSCAGTLTLTAQLASTSQRRRARRVTIGRGRFSIRPGRTARVRVKLTKRGLKTLRAKRTKRLGVTLRVSARNAQGARANTTGRVTLKLAKTPRKRR